MKNIDLFTLVKWFVLGILSCFIGPLGPIIVALFVWNSINGKKKTSGNQNNYNDCDNNMQFNNNDFDMQMQIQNQMNDMQNQMNTQFNDWASEEARKAVTPFDHGGYVQGYGFNPSDTMAGDAQRQMNNDMNNMGNMGNMGMF